MDLFDLFDQVEEPETPAKQDAPAEPENLPEPEAVPETESVPDENSGKLYYTIGEVAAMLGEATSLVRFWSDNFPKIVRPKRTMNKNNRIYTPKDVAALRKIHYLVKECGLTLEGARRKMKTGGDTLDNKVEAVRRLRAIRESLKKIHDEI